MFRCFVAGYYSVQFADFWLADQFNSLKTIFVDTGLIYCSLKNINGTAASVLVQDAKTVIFSNSSETRLHGVGNCPERNSILITIAIGSIPALMRFLQCLRRFYDSGKWFPHLVNAGKYATAIANMLIHGLIAAADEETRDELKGVEFLANIITTMYVLVWDLKMDWGFFDEKAPKEQRFLRDEIVYNSKGFYYFAIESVMKSDK